MTKKIFLKGEKQKKMVFETLLAIKHAPFSSLPSLSGILDKVLSESQSQLDSIHLLTIASSPNPFPPDFSTCLLLHCEYLEQDEFVVFAELLQCSLRASDQCISSLSPEVWNFQKQHIYLLPREITSSSTSLQVKFMDWLKTKAAPVSGSLKKEP